VSSGFTRTAAADDSPKPSAELRVLEDMIGTWDEVMTNNLPNGLQRGAKSTAVTKRVWALGGKFNRAEEHGKPADRVPAFDELRSGRQSVPIMTTMPQAPFPVDR